MTTNEVSLLDALELMVFCNYEGQIDQKSEFETQLYKDLRHQILAKIKDSRQLCFIWMFLRSWGPSGRDSTLRMVKLCYTIRVNICILSQKACDSIDEAFIASVTEDDYNYAVSQVIIGPEKKCLFEENSDDEILELIRKIHVKLEDSPVTIMPFIKSCTRNAVFYSLLKY